MPVGTQPTLPKGKDWGGDGTSPLLLPVPHHLTPLPGQLLRWGNAGKPYGSGPPHLLPNLKVSRNGVMLLFSSPFPPTPARSSSFELVSEKKPL